MSQKPIQVPANCELTLGMTCVDKAHRPHRLADARRRAIREPCRRHPGRLPGRDGRCVHTAGTSSQIADGAAALMLMTRERAEVLGLSPLATIVDACLVGCDPVLMLEGPVPATRKLLDAQHMMISDLDVIEINEAFAAVVPAWERELKATMNRVNPNGGAIALGHPPGATGAMLLTKAVHELARTEGEHALVTMCCGGGLGTGTLLRRG